MKWISLASPGIFADLYLGKSQKAYSALNDNPAPRWDMVKNNQLQLCLTNKEHALNFDPFSKWTVISLMNYNFLIS